MHFSCVQDTKYKQKSKVHEFLAWGRKGLDMRSPELKWVKFWWSSIATEANNTKGVKTGPARHTLWGFQNTQTGKTVAGAEGKKKSIFQDGVKCVLALSSEVKLGTSVNSALFRFTKGLVLWNTIQWHTTQLSTGSFCILGLRSTIYSVKL